MKYFECKASVACGDMSFKANSLSKKQKKRVGCFANHYNNQLFSINPGDNKTSRKTDCKKISHLIATFVAGYDSSVNFMTDSHHHKNTEQG